MREGLGRMNGGSITGRESGLAGEVEEGGDGGAEDVGVENAAAVAEAGEG